LIQLVREGGAPGAACAILSLLGVFCVLRGPTRAAPFAVAVPVAAALAHGWWTYDLTWLSGLSNPDVRSITTTTQMSATASVRVMVLLVVLSLPVVGWRVSRDPGPPRPVALVAVTTQAALRIPFRLSAGTRALTLTVAKRGHPQKTSHQGRRERIALAGERPVLRN
jgi:hypothetical protein